MKVCEALESATSAYDCYFRSVCGAINCGDPDRCLGANINDADLERDAEEFLREKQAALRRYEERLEMQRKKKEEDERKRKEIAAKRRATKWMNHTENSLIKQHKKRINKLEEASYKLTAIKTADSVMGCRTHPKDNAIEEQEKLIKQEIEKSKAEIVRLEQIKKDRAKQMRNM